MEPTLTWLDLTANDRDKMRRVLDLFSEKGTVDELGLGSLTRMLSDDLFPGTSVIQSRLRYVLFVPWLYMQLERERSTDRQVGSTARNREISLIDALVRSEDTLGVIGARARGSLNRVPSEIYWPALVGWRIFQHSQNQGWYHQHFAGLLRGEDLGRADDPGVVWARKPNWHPRLPEAPSSFPAEAAFALTPEEAEFLRGRLVERCAGSLLGWLAEEGCSSPAAHFWDDPDTLRGPESLRHTVELARRFSLHLEAAPLVYNLLLALRRHAEQGTDESRIEEYRAQLGRWAAQEAEEAPFEPETLWRHAALRGAKTPGAQVRFIEAWSARIRDIAAADLADDRQIMQLIEQREIRLKGHRARLTNKARLLDWSGSVGVGRMDFRWSTVRQLIVDLHKGLEG